MYVKQYLFILFSWTKIHVQSNFSGSNTDGSFTTAVSNSFLRPLEQNPIAANLG